ncbi:MAG: hypothetical protein HYX90_09240 [Chloroflexi bacterium]|nr:hypothetical protein [Chloroflexota bacterium]
MRVKKALIFACAMSLLVLVAACSQNAAPTPDSTTGQTSTAPSASPSAATPTVGTTTTTPKTTIAVKATAVSGVSFAGKTITMVVPYAPGGSSDILARVLSKHLGRFLPGNPAVVVRNIAGGEAIIGTNQVFASKPDGLTIMVGGGSVAMADLLDKPALKFDSLTQMTGVLVSPPGADIYYFQPGIFDKPEDIIKAKGIIYGQISGATTITFVSIKEMIGIPTDKIVTAYAGAGESRRAFMAGEITATGETNLGYAQTLRPFHEKGEIKVLCQNGMVDGSGNIVKHPGFPADIMTAKELYEKINGKAPTGPAFDAYRSIMASVKAMDKFMLLPPGASDDVKKAYWTAVENMVKDSEFRKTADPVAGAGADWTAGEAFDKRLKSQFGLKPEIRGWLQTTLKKYGMVLE